MMFIAFLSLLNLVRHVGDYNAGLEEQRHAQHDGRLRVQELVPPVLRHELRYHDGDRFIRLPLGRDLFHVLEYRFEEQTVGRVQDDQAHALTPGLPLVLHLGRFVRVKRDVHCRDIVGEQASVTESLERPPVHATDRQNHPMAADRRRLVVVIQRQVGGQTAGMTMDAAKNQHYDWYEDQDDVRAVLELRSRKDDGHDRGHEGAKTVDHHLRLPTGLVAQRRTALFDLPSLTQVTDLPPTMCHAGLRERERKEYAYRVERDQGVDAGFEDDDEQASDQGQEDDAARENQPAATEGKLPRHETIGGEKSAEAREVGIRRVSGHDQDHCRADDQTQVEQI